MATVVLRWRKFEEGGRRSGPPLAPVYVSTCVFPLGGEDEVHPGWPLTSEDQLSILLEEIEVVGDSYERRYNVDFLVPDLARPYVRSGAQVIVLEGPNIVATGMFEQVTDSTAG